LCPISFTSGEECKLRSPSLRKFLLLLFTSSFQCRNIVLSNLFSHKGMRTWKAVFLTCTRNS
jgi:hypothetical protein